MLNFLFAMENYLETRATGVMIAALTVVIQIHWMF